MSLHTGCVLSCYGGSTSVGILELTVKNYSRLGPAEKKIKLNFDEVIFESWCRGETGCDIVDAGMRELNATGWVSNRARQLLASHLIYELNIDWRYGAAYFESQL